MDYIPCDLCEAAAMDPQDPGFPRAVSKAFRGRMAFKECHGNHALSLR
jgi:hypothetical protein